MRRSTHSAKLERWLGREAVEHLSAQALGWYGPPIRVANVPGSIYVGGDGDFVGLIRGGGFASALDYLGSRARSRMRHFAERQARTANTGFSSLSDFLSEVPAKTQTIFYVKAASTNTATNQTLWPVGSFPTAGSAGSNIPGGSVPDNTTTGGLRQMDPSGSDQLYLVNVNATQNAAQQTLLLYDRIFHAANVLHTTTGNQAVSGTPTRYTGTSSAGVFITLEVTSNLGTTAHNATITYVDDQGNTAEAGSAQAVTASSVANRLPLPTWFYALNSPDAGTRNVTNIAFSAVSSGTSQLVMGKPLLFVPNLSAQAPIVLDGVNSCFNFAQIQAGACLAFMCFQNASTATTYSGIVTLVSG